MSNTGKPTTCEHGKPDLPLPGLICWITNVFRDLLRKHFTYLGLQET